MKRMIIKRNGSIQGVVYLIASQGEWRFCIGSKKGSVTSLDGEKN